MLTKATDETRTIRGKKYNPGRCVSVYITTATEASTEIWKVPGKLAKSNLQLKAVKVDENYDDFVT